MTLGGEATRLRMQIEDFTTGEKRVLARLKTAERIQHFLDDLRYRIEDGYCSPRTVMRERRAHCFDGALFAAAALERLGYRPLVVELVAERDDSHMIASYKMLGCWGAVAKSNFAG